MNAETRILACCGGMVVVSGDEGCGTFAVTEGAVPAVSEKDLKAARSLGRRVAETAWIVRRGTG